MKNNVWFLFCLLLVLFPIAVAASEPRSEVLPIASGGSSHLTADPRTVYLPFVRDPSGPLWVDDFDDCNSRNMLGGAMGAAYNPPDKLVERYIHEDGRGCVAKLEYTIEHWAAFWMKLMGTNLSTYGALTFEIRGDASWGAGNSMKVELKKQADGVTQIGIARVGNITGGWQTVTILFGDFEPFSQEPRLPAVRDWNNMTELVFVFEQGWSPARSSVYIDNVRFD